MESTRLRPPGRPRKMTNPEIGHQAQAVRDALIQTAMIGGLEMISLTGVPGRFARRITLRASRRSEKTPWSSASIITSSAPMSLSAMSSSAS